jgi:hypothetical protein
VPYLIERRRELYHHGHSMLPLPLPSPCSKLSISDQSPFAYQSPTLAASSTECGQ